MRPQALPDGQRAPWRRARPRIVRVHASWPLPEIRLTAQELCTQLLLPRHLERSVSDSVVGKGEEGPTAEPLSEPRHDVGTVVDELGRLGLLDDLGNGRCAAASWKSAAERRFGGTKG